DGRRRRRRERRPTAEGRRRRAAARSPRRRSSLISGVSDATDAGDRAAQQLAAPRAVSAATDSGGEYDERDTQISSETNEGRTAHLTRGFSSVNERSRFDAKVRNTIGVMSPVAVKSPAQEGHFVRFVKSRSFTVVFAVLIVLSTLLIGIETQVLSSLSVQGPGSKEVLSTLSTMNYAITFLFTMEIVAKLYVFRTDFFIEDRAWNCIDLIILLLALTEVALEVALEFTRSEPNMFENGGTAKMLRLFRLSRLLRLLRTFRQLKPLRMLVQSILFAGRSVFWALMLLIMIVYAFGVILTQAVTEHTKGGTQIEDDDLILRGGGFRRLVSVDAEPLDGRLWRYQLDLPHRLTAQDWEFYVDRLISGVHYFRVLLHSRRVFCQNAFEGAQRDLDLSIEAQLREKQTYVDRLELLFREMREDSSDGASNELTAAELHFQLAKPKVQSWFRIDIDVKQTWKLFKILDINNSGRVSLDDFVEGCLTLRGQATRVDVESLKWEIRGATIHAEEATERLAKLTRHIQDSKASSTRGERQHSVM
ncbi:unnamed protein product, partial [Prorocentrum cordatum]